MRAYLTAVLATLAFTAFAVGGATDEFTIELEELVDVDVPGPGAGSIEAPGNEDIYTFTIDAPTTIFFNVLATTGNIAWFLEDPDGTVLFNVFLANFGPLELDLVGDYTITVYGFNGATGTYSFTIWETNDDFFDIEVEELVDVDVPAPGAGTIEEPGDTDVYTLTLDRPTTVYFEVLATTGSIAWSVEDPGGTLLFSIFLGDVGPLELEAGNYTITVAGFNGATGTYSFTTWSTNDDFFSIGLEELVDVDVPGPGAGTIEEPGDTDVYTLTVDRPTTVFFDLLATAGSIAWTVEDPDGALLFNVFLGDVGPLELELAGEYVITTYGFNGATGSYSFTIWATNDDFFEIELEDLVDVDVPGPGAGTIEDPGDTDVYTFAIDTPTDVFFDVLATTGGIAWVLEDPDGSSVFNVFLSDVGPLELTIVGEYTLTVYGANDNTGTYSFTTTGTSNEVFEIELEEIVDVDVPGPGAGNIEAPGDTDVYSLHIAEPTTVYFDSLGGANGLGWFLEDPDGLVLFNVLLGDFGPLDLELVGDYAITVYGTNDATGTYSFTTWATNDDVFEIGLEELVDVDVPGPGAGTIEDPGDTDVYVLTVDEPVTACFDTLSADVSIAWIVEDPNGDQLFNLFLGDVGNVELELSGEYIITVDGFADATGTYSFIVRIAKAADFNGDCLVDGLDLGLLLAAWGPCDEDCIADLNGDGEVNGADLGVLLGEWGV